MTSSPLLGGALGGVLGVGVFVIIAAWHGQLDRPARPDGRPGRGTWDRLGIRAALAVAGMAVAAVLTGWPVAVVGAGWLGWVIPTFAGVRGVRRRRLARAEAIAVWAEMLRDLLVSNAGLNEAIGKSARVAPEAIRDEVQALYVRAQRGDLSGALGRFADELAEPVADTVVAALQIAERRAVSDLGSMLAAVATSTREMVAMQLRVNAARARTYRTAQLIVVIVGFFVGLLLVANRDYMAPFGTATGQVVLAVAVALVALSLWAMVALSKPAQADRLLAVGAGRRVEP
ncbi:MAG: type II secretion system F family protein [Desertimonas sp.]